MSSVKGQRKARVFSGSSGARDPPPPVSGQLDAGFDDLSFSTPSGYFLSRSFSGSRRFAVLGGRLRILGQWGLAAWQTLPRVEEG